MSAAEVVHPLDRTRAFGATGSGSMRGGHTRLVLYSLVGEELEAVEEGKGRTPDTNLNAFPVQAQSPEAGLRLHDVQRAFPLGGAFHFAFRTERGVLVDLTNPSALVPAWDNKIVARVTPLADEPSIKYVTREKVEEPSERYSECVESTTHVQYEEFQSFHASADHANGRRSEREDRRNERQDHREDRHDERRDQRSDRDREWKSSSSSQAEDDDHYDDGSARGSGAATANAEWIRKQTEQAYDFAKKISIEDAKKNASETAKKAKKWGASLLSSAKASIASATSAIKSETVIVGGLQVNIVRPLAEGAYAQVFLVRSQASGETMALKRVICQSEEVERDVKTELRVLRTVKHLNVMPLVEFAESRQQNLEFYFLFPYFDRGSLWDSINAARESSSPLWPFNQRVALHLFRGICAGVLAVHRGGFCHRDLKPHNVLLTSSSSGEDFMSFIPVVTDFGSCAPIRVEVRSRKNSLDLQDEANRKSSAPYRAPELFEPSVDAVVDGQSDVWSLGCILYAMAFSNSPFEHPREGFMKLACMNGRVTFPPDQNGVVRHRSTQFSHEFCDFIRDMLHVNPEERPSVLDALEFAEELLSDEMKR